MNPRRSFIRMLLASPVVGIASNTLDDDPPYPEPYYAENVASVRPFDPIRDAYHKARQAADARRSTKNQAAQYLPPHIAEMRSWSSSFKSHVAIQEQIEFENSWNWQIEDVRQMKAILERFGIL